jgi:hypothetical protein
MITQTGPVKIIYNEASARAQWEAPIGYLEKWKDGKLYLTELDGKVTSQLDGQVTVSVLAEWTGDCTCLS